MEEEKKYSPIENEPEMASEPTGMAMANPNVVKPSRIRVRGNLHTQGSDADGLGQN